MNVAFIYPRPTDVSGRDTRRVSDKDALVIQVEQVGGAACHTGHRSCFFTHLKDGAPVEEGVPVFDPSKVYKK